MKLTNCKDTEFEMTVVDYQFPRVEHEPYDADWLNICVKVKHFRGAWSKIAPCMLTWELTNLADWLESITRNNLPYSKIGFIEPELKFEWFGEPRNILRVYLHYSLRPSWSPYHGQNEEKELFVDFTVTSEDLRDAKASLRSEIKQFPARAKMRS